MSKITVKHYLNTRLKPEIDDKVKIYPLYLSITYDRMNIRTPSEIYNGIATTIKEGDIEKNKIEKQISFKLKYEKDLIERCVIEFEKDEKAKRIKKDYYLLYPLKKYRSKNERLNILNSYVDFYTHSIYDVVSNFLYNEIKTEILKHLNNGIKEFDLLDNNKMEILLFPNNPNLYKLIIKYNLGFKYELYFILWSRLHSFLAEQGVTTGYDMPYLDWIQGKGQIVLKKFVKTYKREVTDCWDLDFFTNEKIEECIKIIEKIINNENYFIELLEN
ncbi:hypothetical protein ACNQF7_03760 [Flavobacterium sp. RSP29]|uniref:hypothetical protein n=1 Tax=Flavobacterium sp. RSP29 TaxID=3401731 RepID=UPI003AB0C319